jgi:hypothetical protein
LAWCASLMFIIRISRKKTSLLRVVLSSWSMSSYIWDCGFPYSWNLLMRSMRYDMVFDLQQYLIQSFASNDRETTNHCICTSSFSPVPCMYFKNFTTWVTTNPLNFGKFYDHPSLNLFRYPWTLSKSIQGNHSWKAITPILGKQTTQNVSMESPDDLSRIIKGKWCNYPQWSRQVNL